MLAHTNENVIDSSGAAPATYCQTAGMWPIALFFSYICTKIIDLICQKIYEHRITRCNPTISPSIAFFPHKGQYVSFQSSETYYAYEIFQELKFSCENLHAFVKTHKNFTCPKLISLLFHPPAVSATTPESLSGWKMARLMQSFCPLRSLAPWVLPISQTNASWKIMEQTRTKWPTREKGPFTILFWPWVRK